MTAELTRPTLQPGTIPGPPTRAAPMLETIAPYKLGITITSNWLGLATSCIDLQDSFLKLAQIDMIKCIRIVDNHIIILDARRLILFRNSSEGVEEKTITEFHDIRFMYASDFLFECCT